jgi:signal transduction histidine kinase
MNDKKHLINLLIHDLTGPLSVVAASANNLLKKKDQYGLLTDQQSASLKRISRNSHRAQTLLHELIEILRSEEGVFQKDFFLIEKVLDESLVEVLEMIIPVAVETLDYERNPQNFQRILKENDIFIEITGKYATLRFCHDQRKVRQIFRNLISNALKYRSKSIRISVGGESDLHVSVEDDGHGIPLVAQQSIFEHFVRIDEKKDPHISGLGMGLTGVKALVEAMKGEIILESREGGGTCFKVWIPSL